MYLCINIIIFFRTLNEFKIEQTLDRFVGRRQYENIIIFMIRVAEGERLFDFGQQAHSISHLAFKRT